MVTLLVNKDETTDKNLETKYKSALNTAKQYSKKLLYYLVLNYLILRIVFFFCIIDINVVNIKEFYQKYNKPQNQITSWNTNAENYFYLFLYLNNLHK